MRTRGLFAVAALAAAAFLAGLALDAPSLRLATKALPVLCLALAVRSFSGGGAYPRFVSTGLLLSALGDELLEVQPSFFVYGLGAFLCAHVAYLAAFLSETRQAALLRLLPFAAWGVGAYAFLRPGLGSLGIPVAAYMAAIVAMMWRAAARVGGAPRGETGARLALAGAVLFAASDSLIAFDRFHSRVAGARYPIILSYWAGQLLIALSARPGAVGREGTERSTPEARSGTRA